MRVQIDPRVASDPDAYQWLDRILHKIVDGWHVWDTTDQADPSHMESTTWIRDSGEHVREMLVASIQRAAWTLEPHGRFVRVTTKPSTPEELTPEDAARLAEEPVCILVENRESDRDFLTRIVKELDSALYALWESPGEPVRFDSTGGKGQMPQEVVRRAHGRPYRPRLVAVVDSDRKTPGASPSKDARKLRRTCCRLSLPCWILAKREAENYLPRILLTNRPDVGVDHQGLVDAWDRLTDDQKNVLDMKFGLRKATSGAEQQLFAGVPAADRKTLHCGFGKNLDKCWTLSTVPAESELIIRGQGDLELGISLFRSEV